MSLKEGLTMLNNSRYRIETTMLDVHIALTQEQKL